VIFERFTLLEAFVYIPGNVKLWESPRQSRGLTQYSYNKSVGKYMGYMMNPKKKGYASALESAREILESNPEYLGRYDKLALIYLYGFFMGHGESSAICMFKAIETVKKSLSLDKTNAIAHMIMGSIFLVKKEHDNAIASFKKSIELDSLASVSYWTLAMALNYVGNPEQALESMKIAYRISPVPPAGWSVTLAQSYRMLEQYEKAIKTLNRHLERKPDDMFAYLHLAIVYGYSGQEKNSKTAIIQLLNLVPDYSIEQYIKIALFKNPARIERIIKTLRKAGLPES
jgi:tetratricopeptide (TPR) repeat protein